MVVILFQWMLIFLGSLAHPYYLAVTDIRHNASQGSVEIICKTFTDDFETVLSNKSKSKVDLVNTVDVKGTDAIIESYIREYLSISADGKLLQLRYLGFEREEEAVYSYLEVTGVKQPVKIEVVNRLLHDLNPYQINIMHVTVDGKRKSIRLDYPASKASFDFK